MKKSLLLIIGLVLFISACEDLELPSADVGQPVGCTKELKICDDGTSVGRNADLNCEFDPCPELYGPSEQECNELGGSWERSFGPGFMCVLATADAGKACSDSSECESFCEAPEGTDPDTPVTGSCFELNVADCMQEVNNGVADPMWCI